jgi:hypothetical protein
MGIPQMMMVIALMGFALWKQGWLRIIFSLCLIIWGVSLLSYDIKIAAPLIGLGAILFITATMHQISAAHEGGEQ